MHHAPQHYVKCLAERAKAWDREERNTNAAESRSTPPENSSPGPNTNADNDLERIHCVTCDRYFSSEAQLKHVSVS